MNKTIKNFNKFVKKTGLIRDDDLLKSIGAPDGFDCGMWDANGKTARELFAFCEKNKGYHVLTVVDSDSEEIHEIIVNYMARVNRVSYFLGKGDSNPELEYIDID